MQASGASYHCASARPIVITDNEIDNIPLFLKKVSVLDRRSRTRDFAALTRLSKIRWVRHVVHAFHKQLLDKSRKRQAFHEMQNRHQHAH